MPSADPTDHARGGEEEGRSDALVMFGASGDLAAKKLFPSLHAIALRGRLPSLVVGVGRTQWDDDDLRERVEHAVREHGEMDEDDAEQALDALLDVVHYVQGDYGDDALYEALADEVADHDRPVFYLAVPPSVFERVIEGFVTTGLNECGRLVLEKPFGRDLASARELNAAVLDAFPEHRIHRIDHFLGKEQVLDLLVFRLANTFVAPAWNRHHVASVQITMAEDFGVEGRGGFYDEAGALRDVVQNHLLQVLALVAMEPPVSADARALRDEKVKVLRSMQPLDPSRVVRGQFDGYRDQEGVDDDSDTETYVALEARIDSWRWAGVPFYIRAGKHLPVTATEVLVEFEPPPQLFFSRGNGEPPHPNHLRFRIKPGEQVALGVQVKEPGDQLVSREVDLTYTYDEQTEGPRDEAYARLLDDAMDGDQRLFARADGVEEAWRIIQPVLDDPPTLHTYEQGSWGPDAAGQLTAATGGWHRPKMPGE